jgi:hypothetical protein
MRGLIDALKVVLGLRIKLLVILFHENRCKTDQVG